VGGASAYWMSRGPDTQLSCGHARARSRYAARMGNLIYSMSVSLDGFAATPTGSLDWVDVDEELHDAFDDEAEEIGTMLFGRRMWEVMAAYWPTADTDPEATPAMLRFARIWRDTPKVVFSRTLEQVDGDGRLVRDDAVAELARLKADEYRSGDAIELIEYAGLIRFQIWGFAPEPWGSIYDLMYLTEELPGFTKWLLEPSGVGHIDLPEQGTQRKLNFTLSGSIVTVSCAPYYINFTPDPEFEYIELEDLKDMTRNLVVDYLYYASKYASRVYNHPWFQDWCNSIDEQFRTPPT